MKNKAGLQKRVSSIFGDSQADKNASYPIGDKERSEKDIPKGSSDSKRNKSYLAADFLDDSKELVNDSRSLASDPALPSKRSSVKPVSEQQLKKEENRRQIGMFILMGVLFCVLILVLVNSFGFFSKTDKAMSEESEGIIKTVKIVNIDWERPPELPAQIRDITKKASLGGGFAGGDIIVRGIIHSQEKSSVIIGKQIYGEGDMVGNTKIVKIDKHSVDFEKDGNQWSQKVER